MQYGKLLGWGVMIYAVMYLLIAALSLYQVGPLLTRILALGTLVVVVSVAGLSLRRHSAWDAIPYALAWVTMVIMLDGLMTVPYIGWQLYVDWHVWVGYALVLIVPLLSVQIAQRARM